MPEEHKYRLLYQMVAHPEGVKKEDVPEGWGACDAVILHSILFPSDGSYGVLLLSRDGRVGGKKGNEETELNDNELFKAWTLMAKRLADSETLHPAKKELAATLFSIVQNAILSSQGKD